MSLTGASAILQISVPTLYDTPVQLQQFSADDIFDSEEVARIETQMGVDGVLSGGFVWNEVPMGISLQSNSPSIPIFTNWIAAEEAAQDTLPANLTVVLIGIKTKFACTKGFLVKSPRIPSVAKLIKPQKFTINWQRVSPAPTS